MVLLVGSIVLIAGCFILRPAFLYWRKLRQLRLRGIVVQGQIVQHYQKRGHRGQPQYCLTFRYTYEGHTYYCDQVVWRTHYEDWEPLVSIRCLPDKPKVAIVVGDDFLSAQYVMMAILGILFLLVGAFILIGSPLGVFAPRHS